MIYELVIKEEAEIEVQDAFSYYQKQRKGLGFRFMIN
jgi:hypothetical protein